MPNAASVGQPNPPQPSPPFVVNGMGIQVGAEHESTKQETCTDEQCSVAVLGHREGETCYGWQCPKGDAIVRSTRGHG